jgi:hypothetical protein
MINRSPQRGTFQLENKLKQVEDGKISAEDAQPMLDMYHSWQQQQLELEETDEWKVDNMEYDLRSTKWICDKVTSNSTYAQNLYAALCNNDFVKNDVWPLLQDKRWHCSWRHSGGIIADMIQQGDYIDWYCSGITEYVSDEEFHNMSKEDQEKYIQMKNTIMTEGQVTDEVRKDLLKLGWIVIEDDTPK